MNYFTNLKIALQLITRQKKVYGRYVDIWIQGKNGKLIKTKAKIDTGAYSSSIKSKFLERLGYNDILNLTKSDEFIKLSEIARSQKRRQEFNKEEMKDIISKHPEVHNIGRIYSSNGVELRPFFKLNVRISKIGKFKSKTFNFSTRKGLRSSVILGRSAIRDLIIDVNQDYFRAVRKKTKNEKTN